MSLTFRLGDPMSLYKRAHRLLAMGQMGVVLVLLFNFLFLASWGLFRGAVFYRIAGAEKVEGILVFMFCFRHLG